MLTAVYYMLRDGVEYRDLGAMHFDRRDKTKTIPPPRAAALRPRLQRGGEASGGLKLPR
jgi:hypothetical protein